MNDIIGDGGGPYDTLKNTLSVHVADVHNVPVNDFVHRTTVASTVAVAVVPGDIIVEVADASIFPVGTYLHFGPTGETTEPIHPQVTDQDIPGGLLTLDRPIDFAYAIGDNVAFAVVNMAAGTAGATIAAPVVYRYRPHGTTIEHIERILITMTHASAAADNLFGDQAALLEGIVLRAVIGGQIGTFTVWKTNSDLKLDMFDVVYAPKVGSSDFGTNARGSFNRIGVVIRLDPAAGDYLELLVQSPLTVNSLRIKAQGHVEGA